ncbi:MAG: TonB-dependent receptor plug domain-containing protein, partial [Pseudomonadales bacterium]|nr:TonB-dependent receptor plug domain-containing protein [Pseudomonadales bacterium]
MRTRNCFSGFIKLLTGIVVLLTIPAVPALAEDETVMEEVIVTGSRIRRDAGTYVGPMTVLDGSTITSDPNLSLNDALLEIPSIGAQGTQRNNANGGRGASFSGIHQLTPTRTLTLWNGRRAVSTIRDTLGLGVDLQSFPVNMIDRVEILADGASAIYGSDAVAGVINLIPKTDFDGIELTFGGGAPTEDGGEHFDAGVLFGITGDRGFFTAGVTLVRDGDVDFQDRDWSQVPLLGSLDIGGGTVLNLVGSGIPPEGRVFLPSGDIIFKPNPDTGESFQVYDTFCLGGGPGSDGSGSIDCILNQGHRFNYNDIPTGVSLINENDNINFSGIGEFRFNNDVVGYINVNLAHREGRLNFTPLPVQGAAGRFTDLIQIPFDNPNIPADALAVIQADLCTNPADPATCPPTFQMNWRGLDLGPRTLDYDRNTL